MVGKLANALKRWFDVLLCILDSRAHESHPLGGIDSPQIGTDLYSYTLEISDGTYSVTAILPGASALDYTLVCDAPDADTYASFAAALSSGDSWDDGQDVKAGGVWYRYFSAATRAGGLVPKFPFGDSRTVTGITVIESGFADGDDPRIDPGYSTVFSGGTEDVDWSIASTGGGSPKTRFSRTGSTGFIQIGSAETCSAADVAVLTVIYGVTVTNSMTAPLAFIGAGSAYASGSTQYAGGAFVAPAVSASNWCHRTGATTYTDSGVAFTAGETLFCAVDASTARILSTSSESADSVTSYAAGGTRVTTVGAGYPSGAGTITADVTAFAVYRLSLSS